MIIRVSRALDWPSSMSWTKIMVQKPRCAQKSKNHRSLPLVAGVARDNSLREHARELFEPSKDSWSVLVCTEKNTFWDWGLGFSVAVVRKRVGFTFFWLFFYDGITRTMSQNVSTPQPESVKGLVDQMTATVFRQSSMTQRPSLFTLISYCAIVFSFALMFANGWFTAWRWLSWRFYLLAESYETINHYQWWLKVWLYSRRNVKLQSPRSTSWRFWCPS